MLADTPASLLADGLAQDEGVIAREAGVGALTRSIQELVTGVVGGFTSAKDTETIFCLL